MKKRSAWFLVLGVAALVAAAILKTATGGGEAPRMTKEALEGRLGEPDLVVVDVRSGGSWADSSAKIKGAVREDPQALEEWAQKYPKEKTLVFYCS